MKLTQEEIKLIAWILTGATIVVSLFALYYVIYALTFVPPEEVVINITQALE